MKMDNGMTKIHNKKHIKEIIRQFEVKYSNIGKEAIILSSNYYP